MTDQFPESKFSKLDKALENVLVENKLQAVLYFRKIYKHWDIIVGESLALKTVPSKLVRNVLYVTVEDAAYSHHLNYFEKNILDLIASPEICGEGSVKKIVFRVGSKSVLKTRKEISKELQEKKPEIDAEVIKQADEVSDKISDQGLRNVFQRYMSKSISRKSSPRHT
ncbi:DUF721 domain-containing protein [bacterium]|nr:DUF721 domain-containing protein [bacterium]